MPRFLLVAIAVTACSGSGDAPGNAPADAAAMEDANDTSISSDTSAPETDAVAEAGGNCPCFFGDGPYCAGRAADEAKKLGCTIPDLAKWPNDLLACESSVWRRLEDCPGACKFTATATKLDDGCELPVCACFVKDAYCGSGAGERAGTMGCRVPLLPEHNDDIVACSADGKWIVKQECSKGCQVNPTGVADACKTDAAYKFPFDCGRSTLCSNGNRTALHDGKDEYAYDFPAPVGTTVRAMRAGTVLAVRNVSKPGDACYNGGGSACANPRQHPGDQALGRHHRALHAPLVFDRGQGGRRQAGRRRREVGKLRLEHGPARPRPAPGQLRNLVVPIGSAQVRRGSDRDRDDGEVAELSVTATLVRG